MGPHSNIDTHNAVKDHSSLKNNVIMYFIIKLNVINFNLSRSTNMPMSSFWKDIEECCTMVCDNT